MRGLRILAVRRLLAALGLASLLYAGGCVGLASQLLYVVKGNNTEAKYKGLAHKRVAVVCATPNHATSGNGVPQQLAAGVGVLLAQNVKGIKIVPQSEIEDWRDRRDWDGIDYKAVGRGVKADMVLEIKLASFSVNEGSAFFKGKAQPTITVYDMSQNGKQVFQEGPVSFEFPKFGVQTATETTEAQFQAVVVRMLAETIAKNFYAYDRAEDFGNDARFQTN